MKVGSVVRFKKNGKIPMTIEKIVGEDVSCFWFKENELNHGTFNINRLELVQTKTLVEKILGKIKNCVKTILIMLNFKREAN